jgi:regulator of sirC expression with transglutaminase-like and TPR domain
MARVRQIYGQETAWDEAYLQAVSDHTILQRLLYNLKVIYAQRRDFERTLGVVERLLLLHPEAAGEVRDRGLLHYQMGHFEAALDDLQHYLQLAPDAPDAAAIRRHVAVLRQRLGR